MTVVRMDNVGIVVEDLDAAVAFFVELGLELEGRMPVEDEWAARVVGIDGARSEVAMVRTPDGTSKLELMRYRQPAAVGAGQPSPVNTLGLHRLMFAVDYLEDVLARLRPHGAELVGEVVRFEDMFLLCYIRGPEGIVIGLAEQLK
ncbi:MAG: VOC family protein [Actinomycetota bacterium]|nr:VOC family protein [Actinomycetota bacterium]